MVFSCISPPELAFCPLQNLAALAAVSSHLTHFTCGRGGKNTTSWSASVDCRAGAIWPFRVESAPTATSSRVRVEVESRNHPCTHTYTHTRAKGRSEGPTQVDGRREPAQQGQAHRPTDRQSTVSLSVCAKCGGCGGGVVSVGKDDTLLGQVPLQVRRPFLTPCLYRVTLFFVSFT